MATAAAELAFLQDSPEGARRNLWKMSNCINWCRRKAPNRQMHSLVSYWYVTEEFLAPWPFFDFATTFTIDQLRMKIVLIQYVVRKSNWILYGFRFRTVLKLPRNHHLHFSIINEFSIHFTFWFAILSSIHNAIKIQNSIDNNRSRPIAKRKFYPF